MAKTQTMLNHHGQKQTNEQCLTTTHGRSKKSSRQAKKDENNKSKQTKYQQNNENINHQTIGVHLSEIVQDFKQ